MRLLFFKKYFLFSLLFFFGCFFGSIFCQTCNTFNLTYVGEYRTFNADRLYDGVYGPVEDHVLLVSRTNNDGLTLLLDVSDKTSPFLVNTIDTLGLPNRITFSPDRSFAILPANGGTVFSYPNLYIIDTSPPISTNFAIIYSGIITPFSNLFDSWIDDRRNRAYVTSSGGRGIIVLDISDLSNPFELHSSSMLFDAYGIDCKYIDPDPDPYCFVNADGTYDLRSFRMENNSVVFLDDTSIIGFGGPTTSLITPNENIAFIETVQFHEPKIIDISNTSDLNPLGAFPVNSFPDSPPRGSSISIVQSIQTSQYFTFITKVDGSLHGLCNTNNFENVTLMNSITTIDPLVDYGATSFVIYDNSSSGFIFYQVKKAGPLSATGGLYIYAASWCGNGVIDPGEECDSGPCCDDTSCTLLPSTTLCRNASNICEYDAYCDGILESCPANTPTNSAACINQCPQDVKFTLWADIQTYGINGDGYDGIYEPVLTIPDFLDPYQDVSYPFMVERGVAGSDRSVYSLARSRAGKPKQFKEPIRTIDSLRIGPNRPCYSYRNATNLRYAVIPGRGQIGATNNIRIWNITGDNEAELDSDFDGISAFTNPVYSQLFACFIDEDNNAAYVTSNGGRGILALNITDLYSLSEYTSTGEFFDAYGIICHRPEDGSIGINMYCWVTGQSPTRLYVYLVDWTSTPGFPQFIQLQNQFLPSNAPRSRAISLWPVTDNGFYTIAVAQYDGREVGVIRYNASDMTQPGDMFWQEEIECAWNPTCAGSESAPRGSGITFLNYTAIPDLMLLASSLNSGDIRIWCVETNDTNAPLQPSNFIGFNSYNFSTNILTPNNSVCALTGPNRCKMRTPYFEYREEYGLFFYLPYINPAELVPPEYARTLVVRVSICGDGILGPGEQCEVDQFSEPCCDETTCLFRNSTYICGSGAGSSNPFLCGEPAVCNGTSVYCPPDTYYPDTTLCHNETSCSAAQYCNGTSLECPPIDIYNSTVLCANGTLCAPDVYCNGTDIECPAQELYNSTVVCANATACADASYCTGISTECSAQNLYNSTVICANATLCADATYCPGNSTECPSQIPYPESMMIECLAANSSLPCQESIFCNGSSIFCPDPYPQHPYSNSSIECAPEQDCVEAQFCSGFSYACDTPVVYKNSSVICSNNSLPCYTDGHCSGNSSICLNETLREPSYICRNSSGPCEYNTNCQHSISGECPPPTFKNASEPCSGSGGSFSDLICYNTTGSGFCAFGNASCKLDSSPLPPGYDCILPPLNCSGGGECDGYGVCRVVDERYHCPPEEYQTLNLSKSVTDPKYPKLLIELPDPTSSFPAWAWVIIALAITILLFLLFYCVLMLLMIKDMDRRNKINQRGRSGRSNRK